MKLQGRNLSIRMQGEDVKLLQSELAQLGFTIPETETSDGIFGPRTEDVVKRFQTSHRLEGTGVVDEQTAILINREVDRTRPGSAPGLLVRGFVRQADNQPFTEGTVRAFDKDLRREESLGEAKPDAAGFYEIRYLPEQFRRAEKKAADLMVRVVDSRRKVLATSGIIFNADAIQTVDFVLPAGPRLSEFERYLAAIKPLLEDTALADLNEDDIIFIAGETGLPELQLGFLALAHLHARATRIEAPAFYGWFRKELPTELSALLLQPPVTIRRALDAAVQEEIIPVLLPEEIDALLAALDRTRAERVLADAPDRSVVSSLLVGAGLSAPEQANFLNAYLGHEGSIDTFWRSLRETPLAAKVETMQATLQLAIVAQNNLPLLDALRENEVHSVRDLPRLGQDKLQQIIRGSSAILSGIPSDMPAETDERKATRTAAGMLDLLHAAMPTAFVQAAYERSGDSVRRDAARILANAPELELRDEPIDRFLAEHPRALEGVSDPEPAKMQLKRVQRALRISPRAEHAEALLEQGLESARSVTGLAPAAFEEMFAEKFGGATEARVAYRKAEQVHASALAVAAAARQSAQDIVPAVILPLPGTVSARPEFSALFGSQSLCTCEHCRSVLSPAAYLVDLLEFLDPKAGPKPLARLRQKRPDIEHILLTCENTNTSIPYVDLVNEVLEFYVANEALTAGAARDTRGMSPDELSVNPQFLLDTAYQKLADAVYPLELPFHRPLEVARLYLDHLGAPRQELMQAFRQDGLPNATDIDLESLRVSPLEGEILAGTSGRPLAGFYGYPATQDPSARATIPVSDFLARTGLSYEELAALLATEVINPTATIRLVDGEEPSRCDLTKTSLTGLTAEFWRTAHRYIRLQRKLGWSAGELDLAFRTLQEGEIGPDLLEKLSLAQELRTRLKLPVNVLLSLWGDLDSAAADSLYARLFLNKAVKNPPDPAFVPGTPENAAASIEDHLPPVLAALRLGVEDFETLRRHLGWLAGPSALSLSNLSALHRHAILARALKLRIGEYVSLVTLIGDHPLPRAYPAATRRFAETVQLVRESGFSVAQLDYLHRHVGKAPDGIAPSRELVLALLRKLQAGLLEGSRPADPSTDALRTGLTAVLGEAPIDAALAVIDGTAPLTEPERGAFIDAQFTAFLDPAEAKPLLLDPAAPAETKRTYVLQRLRVHARKGLVAHALAEALGLDSAVAVLLLETILRSESDPGKPALEDFLSLAELDDAIPKAPADDGALPAELAPVSRGLLRLHKAAMLVQGFDISARELAHLWTHAADFGGFDPNALALAEADFQPAQFQQWLRLAGLFRFRKGLGQAGAGWVDVFAAADLPSDQNPRETAVDRLKQVTGWPSAEVDFLVGTNAFDLAAASDFRNETKLVHLRHCIELAKRLGAPCEQLFAWAAAEPDAAAANDIVSVAKAKYTDEQWLTIAKRLNDNLREKQKAALITHILANDTAVKQAGIRDGNQLFEHFLIDVQMSACMKTSRIKQTISSVQLFVQRCLMNLEAGVSPSHIDAGRWQWMKNYRVWEANRKVFLYPENWIEPELRDDKSPFFEELESELLQNDLTLQTAEDAFVHYLEKLDTVAQLLICGMYVQEPQELGDEEIVHVFGRSKAAPYSHYYRRLLNRRTWTPWEKVDVDIAGDHLIPVVHNRRLCLFWLDFQEKQDPFQQLPHAYIQSAEHYRWLTADMPSWRGKHEAWLKEHQARAVWNALEALLKNAGLGGDEITAAKSAFGAERGFDFTVDEAPEPREPEEPAFAAPPALTRWEIRLACSEYRGGRWSARETSSEYVVSPHVAPTLQEIFADKGPIGLLALGTLNATYPIMPKKSDGSVDTTIFTVHLPARDDHFVRLDWLDIGANSDPPSDGAEPLTLTLFRRYSHSENVLDVLTAPVQGYEILGSFTLRCGNRITAASLPEPVALPYDSLKRPEGTTNHTMWFEHTSGTPKLVFPDEGVAREILDKLPDSGRYRLLSPHQRPEFRLKPPFQDFFYQDGRKCYVAWYQNESPAEIIRVPDHALLVGPSTTQDSFIGLIKQKLLTAPRKSVRTIGPQIRVDANANPTATTMQTIPQPFGQRSSRSLFSGSARLGLQNKDSRAILESALAGSLAGLLSPNEGIRFESFFHPLICEFTERLYRGGIPGLLARATQQLDKDAEEHTNLFDRLYAPAAPVATPYPREYVDFGRGAYALYNWELFFHVPMRIAVSLTQSQRFEDAVYWYHFIFDPTTSDPASSVRRYWNTLPFYTNTHPEKEQIQAMLLTLVGEKPGWKAIAAQIEEWLDDPFNPHRIARLRITAYQKHVVMKYLDNLIAWGDQLFARDTIESINEATLLYVLARNILGPRPAAIPRHSDNEPKTYGQLRGDLDAFGNALVDIENLLPYRGTAPALSWYSSRRKGPAGKFSKSKPDSSPVYTGPLGAISAIARSVVQSPYFCIPQNEEFRRYWDTVDDRLFKIRHCMNIEGLGRELPLFEPPIDPALLVRAKAAGVDLGSVLNELYAPVPRYRFNVLLQKALELTNELKSLGGALLSALEKKDAEDLANLRASQETALVAAMREVKLRQREEAAASIEALQKTRLVTEARYGYYRDIERISTYEQDQMDGLSNAHSFNLAAQSTQALASVAYQFPNTTVGLSGTCSSPVSTVTFGGSTAGAALQSAGTVLGMIASAYSHDAAMAEIIGRHERRWDEWKLQELLAGKELDQIDKQITAAEIRLAITERELENHDRQIANSAAVQEFLQDKYTNDALYGWMITQVSGIYFQAYKLAYDLARRVERCYRHELGLADSDFIRFGYWDNLRKGLLAGEQLTLDLKRLEAAHLERNKREYELNKHVSLLQVNPRALLQLRSTGRCTVALPEELFDLDAPGHYMRRLKSVAVSIPCVVGPYAGIHCRLTLLKSSIRTDSAVGEFGYARTEGGDPRFTDHFGTLESVVTSSAQNDSGLFEANLRDERYLPFENSGAISEWELQLPGDPGNQDPTQFDYETISDVILHLRYTAREGGDLLRNAAVAKLKAHIEEATAAGSARLFSVRHEFPSEWAKFKRLSPNAGQFAELTLEFMEGHYPFWSKGILETVIRMDLFAKTSQNNVEIADNADGTGNKDSLIKDDSVGLHMGTLTNIPCPPPIGKFTLYFSGNLLEDLWLVLTWGR